MRGPGLPPLRQCPWDFLEQVQPCVREVTKSVAKLFMCVSPRSIHLGLQAWCKGNPLALRGRCFPLPLEHLQS